MVKKVVDVQEFRWGFSIISLVFYLLRGLRKALSMASVTLINSPLSPLSSPSSCSSPDPRSWVGQFFIKHEETQQENNNSPEKFLHERYRSTVHGKISQQNSGKILQENTEANKDLNDHNNKSEANPNILKNEGSGESINNSTGGIKLRKRPARLHVPENCANLELCLMERNSERKEFEVEGRDFYLASKKGRREIMEDGYGVMVDILGDPKQAFFTVIDGHGGRAATDYVAENLGRNIVKELGNVGEEGSQLEEAIRIGYQVTDREFLSQGVSSGACAASVLLKDGEIRAANVGDCRAILSRNGLAHSLTKDHRVSREDERLRIEDAGGFVHCSNGVCRVQGSLAVSRAIGDLHLKEWIISEPEITSIPLTSDCEFLIIASDGLWDKVNEQEAVDVVSRNKNSMDSCRKLIDISSSRGNMDDITVMVINLQKFAPN